MWSKCLVTSLPQTELCLSLFGCACLCYAVPVRIGLCLSLLRCARPYWAVPVFVTLSLSLLGCAYLCYAMPEIVQLCWPLRVPLLFINRILTLIPLYKRDSCLRAVDSSVPLKQRDPKNLGLICLVKKRTIHFRILPDLRIQFWIFLNATLKFANIFALSLILRRPSQPLSPEREVANDLGRLDIFLACPTNTERFPFTKKFRKFRSGCKWNTTCWFVPLEIFRNKRNS